MTDTNPKLRLIFATAASAIPQIRAGRIKWAKVIKASGAKAE